MRKGSGILALIGELIPCGMSQHMRMWGSLAASPVRLTIRRNQAVVTGVPASVVKTEGLEPCRGHKARQADCLAGVWAKHAEEKWRFIEPGDVEAAMQTASAIGDDRLQRAESRLCGARRFHPWLVRTTHALVHDRAAVGAGCKLQYLTGGAALTHGPPNPDLAPSLS